MARLNESTGLAPTESIDALKRRFVRQNREIARVNSLQSLRIRTLESEVSRLLGENVSLREKVISLSQEVERLGASKMLHDGIYNIKAKLDAKLTEMQNLVLDLGMLPPKATRNGDERTERLAPGEKKSPLVNLQRKPNETQYAPGLEDGRLPVILEDKYYPRKTLEAQELHNLINNNLESMEPSKLAESPLDLGGRPDDDSLLETTGEPADSYLDDGRVTEKLDTAEGDELPPTLETRKKKTGSARVASFTDLDRESTTIIDSPLYTIRSRAKRKFVAEDDAERFTVMASAGDGDFLFNRTAPIQMSSEPQSPVPKSMQRNIKSKVNEESKMTKQRKVLEPKSVNVNLNSPKKARAALLSDVKLEYARNLRAGEEAPSLLQSKAVKVPNRTSSEEAYPASQVQGTESLNSQQESTADKTAKSSTDESDSQGVSDLHGAPTRATRRHRPVISYALPNLRDKMRRPTKELVDAVGGDHCRRNSSYQPAHSQLADEDERFSDAKFGASEPNNEHEVTQSSLSANDAPEAQVSQIQSNSDERKLELVSQPKRRTSSANFEIMPSCPNSLHPSGNETSLAKDMGPERPSDEICHDLDEYSSSVANKGVTTKRSSRRHSPNSRKSMQALATKLPSSHICTIVPPSKEPELSATLTEGDDTLHDDPEDLQQGPAAQKRQNRRSDRVTVRRKTMMV